MNWVFKYCLTIWTGAQVLALVTYAKAGLVEEFMQYLVCASSEENRDAEDRQNDATRGRILCTGSYVNVYIVSVLCANLSLYIS